MAAQGPTQSDVARRAGVSRGVVSAVLHARASNIRVGAETRERVRRAAADLGYRPNVVARSLVTGKTQTLGLVIPSLTNPFFAQLAEALHSAASERGYDLLIALAEGQHEQTVHQMDYLIQRRVDGLLVWMGREPARYPRLAPVGASPMPYVTLGRFLRDPTATCIGVDRGAGMEQAVDHLVRQGLVRIGYTGSDVEPDAPSDSPHKYAGFLAALARRGFAPSAAIRLPWPRIVPDQSREAGYEIGRELAATDTRPQALLCESDTVALGAIAGLRDGGVRVPGDMAVIGFDDIAEGRFSQPRLTTIAHPVQQLAELGLNALLRQVDDPEAPPERTLLVPPLIVRESCGAGKNGQG